MIRYLYANNYKSFVNFRIEFSDINLLIGKNGSGKSNVFSLIASLRDLIQGNNQALSACFNFGTLTRWMNSDIQTFELGISGKGHDYKYRVEIEHIRERSQNRILFEEVSCEERILYSKKDGRAILYNDRSSGKEMISDPMISGLGFIPQDKEYSLLSDFRKLIDTIILCTPNPKVMLDVANNDIFVPQINFANIASVFAGLIQLEPEIYSDLSVKLKEINPDFVKARISFESYAKFLIFDYKYNDVMCSFHFSELSDGERMLFSLYLLLYGYIKKDCTVLIDEPDNYVSLTEIQPWCMDIEEGVEESGQCIMVSHHPEIIDYMAETRGIWFGRLKSGESTIINPNVKQNPDLMTYSQMIVRGVLDEI